MERFESCEKQNNNAPSYAEWLINPRSDWRYPEGVRNEHRIAGGVPDYTFDGQFFTFQYESQPANKPREDKESKSCLNSFFEYAVKTYGKEVGDAVNKEVSSIVSYVMFNNYREREVKPPNFHPTFLDQSRPFVKEELEMVQNVWDRFTNDQRDGLRMFALGAGTSSESLSPLAKFQLGFVDQFAAFEKQRRS
jgi:hypothetical protein